LGYVPDERLPALYSGAAAFFLPALEEGFGLPLLEALACGVPAAAADSGALPELAAGVGWLFDPLRPEAIAAALEMSLGTRRREELSCLGQERAACYPWERTADGVRELLEGIASG
jgi:glycosyltransferase involved in cell wall biosynthesis